MQDATDLDDLSSLLSFDQPVRRPPPRQDSRLLTLFRVGKLTTDRFEELCLVRNIGVGGMLVLVNSPLVPRQRVRIELRSDRKIWGTVLWLKEGTAGIGFDGQVDIEEILARQDVRTVDRRFGGPRLNIRCRAKLRVESKYYRVQIQDLGQNGVGIATRQNFPDGQDVVVTLEGFRPLQGTALWSRNGRIGIAFNKPIPFHELTQWLQESFGRSWVEKPLAT
jgi:hypothetical protein